MNLTEIETLKARITTRLQDAGPATSQKLAVELAVPHGKVRLALETPGQTKGVFVKRLPFGFWDVTADRKDVA